MTNPSIASDLIERRDTLFDAIAHGDDEHRAWLKEAIDAHFAGQPVPECRGKGRKEAALSQLTREVDDILDEADFLCARLRELENELSDDHTARQFYGHVAPSLARMEALSRSSGRVSDAQ